MDSYKEKIKFPFKCPVCGKEEFGNLDWFVKEAQDKDVEVYEVDLATGKKNIITDPIDIYFVHCSHCGWKYDLKQVLDYDVVGDRNTITVNDLKKEYQNKMKEDPNYNYDVESSKPIPHKCPICGEYEFTTKCSFDICPVCGWQDDGTEEMQIDDYSEVNGISISKAKEYFLKERVNDPKYKWNKRKK